MRLPLKAQSFPLSEESCDESSDEYDEEEFEELA